MSRTHFRVNLHSTVAPISRNSLPKTGPISKGKRRSSLNSDILDSPVTKVFRTTDYIFSILAIFREKWVVKVGPKVLTLGPSSFHENSNPSIFFQTTLFFARVLHLVRISAILDHIWGSQSKRAISWILNWHENFENV